MPKISINLLRYSTPWPNIKAVIDAVLAQDFDDYELIYSENAAPGQAKLIAEVQAAYSGHRRLRIVDNGGNLGYAGGHNKFFAETNAEFLMVLNPDAILQPGFIKNILAAFTDPRVACASGKMLKPDLTEQGQRIIDGTGIIITPSRRARERGQLQIDRGQYDRLPEIFGVSGTAAVYRKSALAAVKILDQEYFDPDFFAYWEDLDLSWRLQLQGFQARYVPSAVVLHSRVAEISPGGYKRPFKFISHHAKLSVNIRRWNWRNHLFAIIKNDFGWNFWKSSPYIFIREAAMFGYIIIFEPRTLGALPAFFRLLPKMLKKRKIIQEHKKVTSQEIGQWFKWQQ